MWLRLYRPPNLLRDVPVGWGERRKYRFRGVIRPLKLMKQGVQIELCGATALANHWGNADLLPGVKVNTNAMVRVAELEQDGYTLIYE